MRIQIAYVLIALFVFFGDFKIFQFSMKLPSVLNKQIHILQVLIYYVDRLSFLVHGSFACSFCWFSYCFHPFHFPSSIYLFRVNNGNTGTLCSKLTIKIKNDVFIVDFELVNSGWAFSTYPKKPYFSRNCDYVFSFFAPKTYSSKMIE